MKDFKFSKLIKIKDFKQEGIFNCSTSQKLICGFIGSLVQNQGRLFYCPGPAYFKFTINELKLLQELINDELKYSDCDQEVKDYNNEAYDRYIERFRSQDSAPKPSKKNLQDLYLIQNRSTKDLKIGVSKDCQRRLEDLQNNSGYEMELLYIIEKQGILEQQLHEKFKHIRMKGEWFEFSQDILDKFEELLK